MNDLGDGMFAINIPKGGLPERDRLTLFRLIWLMYGPGKHFFVREYRNESKGHPRCRMKP